jgi:tetratricopeptide (TPR) repeat protein
MERQVFVARKRELEQLDSFLNRALAGQGQVCFVTGEAGSGKTALVTEFARRAQERHEALIVAVGQSDTTTGVGDPYLPFREVLSQLTGDVEAKLARGAISAENASRLRKLVSVSARFLVEMAPDLVGLFVPGVGLAMKAAKETADKAGWLEKLEKLAQQPKAGEGLGREGLDQNVVFEQYTRFVAMLSDKKPLLLILDDLQWADTASIGLLFRLGRRIGEHRILFVGTYRPEEVAIGRAGERHPLEKVLAELKRYYGDIRVDLDRTEEVEGQHFVNAFLNTEPNRLKEEFCHKLFQHTGGHPLFTIELLRNMQERGDLVRDSQGRWVETQALNWQSLPERVEGVIEERIGRLGQELRQMLTVGSVEGEDFTAEVVARIQAADAGGLIRRLSAELERQHRLIKARGVRRLEQIGQRLSLYRFQHNLFQRYLYNELDEAERIYLHEDVGNALEALYGDQVDEIVVQLARHFLEAGIAEKARTYLGQAGEQAAARFANDEAVTYFSRALDLTPENNLTERYDLLLARQKVYDVQGEREAQAQDLVALEALVEALDDNQRRVEVALRRGRYAGVTCDYSATLAASQTAVRLAQVIQDSSSEAWGYQQWGQALFHQGDYDGARNRLEQALSLARASESRKTEAASLLNLGTIHLSQGDYVEASLHYKQSLHVCQEIGNRRIELRALNNLAIVLGEQGDFAQAEAFYMRTLQSAGDMGDRLAQSMALNNLGVHYEEQGDYAAAESYYEQALEIKKEISDRSGEALTLMNIARIFAKQGEYRKSKPYYQQCLDLFRQIEDKQCEIEGLSFLSLLWHQMGEEEAALEHSQLALDIAQELGDRNSQAYPLTYLGHALVGLDHLAEAAEAYQQAMVLRREFGQPHMAMEPLAGLARVSLAQNDLAQAQTHIEEILSFLEDNTLDGTEEPFLVYLTCYRVLNANRDPRAQEILTTAYGLLQEQAVRISDEELRRSFLENVAAHREILSEWAKGQ